MGVNIMQVLQNPQQAISNMFKGNPMANSLIGLINNKDTNGIEQMARNLAKEKGLDADKLFNEYKSRLGM